MKAHPHVDTELQSFQVFGLICVSILTSFCSGFIIDALGLQWLYAIVTTIALGATVAAVALREPRDLSARLSPVAFWTNLKKVFSSFRDPVYTKVRAAGARRGERTGSDSRARLVACIRGKGDNRHGEAPRADGSPARPPDVSPLERSSSTRASAPSTSSSRA